jgi:hypothetical protein
MTIAADHFAEIEMAICKGKRLAIENVLDWLTVCLRTARLDLERTGDAKSVLETTLASMENMKDVYREKLDSNIKLVSKSVAEK